MRNKSSNIYVCEIKVVHLYTRKGKSSPRVRNVFRGVYCDLLKKNVAVWLQPGGDGGKQ